MSCILYYSNFCQNCKSLLQKVSTTSIKDEMHFICIDKRIKKPNNAIYVQLENGQEILLPPTVNKVPALLLLNHGHKVLFEQEINNYLEPKQLAVQKQVTQNNMEPMAFSLGGGGFGVASDNYSFLDQSSDDLSAKGNGGLRQQHHYSTLNESITIETPPDNYQPDKVGKVSMEQLEAQRQSEINQR